MVIKDLNPNVPVDTNVLWVILQRQDVNNVLVLFLCVSHQLNHAAAEKYRNHVLEDSCPVDLQEEEAHVHDPGSWIKVKRDANDSAVV